MDDDMTCHKPTDRIMQQNTTSPRRQTQVASVDVTFKTTRDVHAYCNCMQLSLNVKERLCLDVKQGFARGDLRSYKNVHYRDRLPASHRRPRTPPGFWDLEIGEVQECDRPKPAKVVHVQAALPVVHRRPVSPPAFWELEFGDVKELAPGHGLCFDGTGDEGLAD